MTSAIDKGICALVLSTGLLCVGNMGAQSAPDNTKANKNAQNKSEQTADKATNAKSDLEVSRQIRRALVNDKSLSTYGHNVKILASNGKVTLKGPVHTDDEKKAIEEHARKIAGDANVVDEITVKGDSK